MEILKRSNRGIMKRKNIQRIIGLIVLLAIVIVTVVTLKNNKEIAAEKVYEYDKTEAIHVITQRVEQTSFNNQSAYSGNFAPNKEVKLSADIQGKITKVFVTNGDEVKVGQPLLQLDQSVLKLQLEAVNTKIRGLEKDIERYQSLMASNAIQGVKLEKAELGLDAAKIERATIQEQLNKTTVRASFDGIITAQLTEEGAFAAPGVPLFQLTDISTVKLTLSVTEYEINAFQRKDSVQVQVDALPNEEFMGIVSMVGSKSNKSMNFPVEISVDNPSMRIKAGMFGHAKTAVSSESKDVVSIPLSAIIGETTDPKVYIVDAGVAKLQSIQTGGTVGNKIMVKEGLKSGDVIVTEGITTLFEGANVTTK